MHFSLLLRNWSKKEEDPYCHAISYLVTRNRDVFFRIRKNYKHYVYAYLKEKLNQECNSAIYNNLKVQLFNFFVLSLFSFFSFGFCFVLFFIVRVYS